MNPCSTNPTWQNYSSLCREVAAAKEAPNEIGKFHHLTASLYFGIATIEAFLNQQMRAHLALTTTTEQVIFDTLRRPGFSDKLKGWPRQILQADLSIAESTMDLIRLFYKIRGNLTHPKTSGHDIYGELETIDPNTAARVVAEYCVLFLETQGEMFPYWFLGWNYLNPRPNTHEIIMINNQQFSHSLQSMGFHLPTFEARLAEEWRRKNMTSSSGYLTIKDAIDRLDHCEPKNTRFPYKPILCRRWWDQEHHRSCGYISPEAIRRVVDEGA